MSEINKTSQQSLQRILDKIGVKSANEKKEKDEMEDSHLEDIPNDGQGTDRKNQSIGLHDPVLKSPDKPAGPS